MFLRNTIHVTTESLVFYNYAAMIFNEKGYTCGVYSDNSRLNYSWSDNDFKNETWGN